MTGDLSPNKVLLERVAAALDPLLDRLVFVGGNVVDLLITDPAKAHVRVTDDVDVIADVTTRIEYERLSEELRELGLRHDTSEGAPICRWLTGEDLIVDVMPVNEEVLGFSNPWYEEAIRDPAHIEISPDIRIRVARAPVFVAAKWAAYKDRGEHDPLASHDLEDIITVVAGRTEVVKEIESGPAELRAWVAQETRRFLESEEATTMIEGSLPDAALVPELVERARERLQAIASLEGG